MFKIEKRLDLSRSKYGAKLSLPARALGIILTKLCTLKKVRDAKDKYVLMLRALWLLLFMQCEPSCLWEMKLLIYTLILLTILTWHLESPPLNLSINCIQVIYADVWILYFCKTKCPRSRYLYILCFAEYMVKSWNSFVPGTSQDQCDLWENPKQSWGLKTQINSVLAWAE